MPKIVTTITPPKDWSERETRMLRLVVNLAASMERNRSRSELLAKMVTALGKSLKQAGIPLVPHDEGAPFEVKVQVEFAAAWQAAIDLAKAEFPEVQIEPEVV